MKYHFYVNVINHNLKHAGSKAVSDCTNILGKQGYELIQLNFYKYKYLAVFNILKMIVQLTGMVFFIKPKSLIVMQYPLFGLKGYFRLFIGILKLKKCFFACIIHDLNSLRYQKAEPEIAGEISNLNAYDIIISHNHSMTEWLKSKSTQTKVIDLEIFDYLCTQENQFNRIAAFKNGEREVIFAGNLSRGKFIYNLGKATNRIYFKLYGPGLDLKRFEKQENVSWEGTFTAEALVEKLKGNFGLIWDGDDVEQCAGQYGNYIAYNNPHKISLYLAAGLPIILPLKAALSKFVIDNNIGVAINSLSELSDIIDNIDVNQYEIMIKNIISISNKLKTGYFFQSAIKRVEVIYETHNNPLV